MQQEMMRTQQLLDLVEDYQRQIEEKNGIIQSQRKKDSGSRHFNKESKGRNDSSEGFDRLSRDLYQNSGIHTQRQRKNVQPARSIDRRPEEKAQKVGGTTGESIIHYKTSKVTKKKKIKSEKSAVPRL